MDGWKLAAGAIVSVPVLYGISAAAGFEIFSRIKNAWESRHTKSPARPFSTISRGNTDGLMAGIRRQIAASPDESPKP
jgi:hypothetical protein